mmetsp:Transcript_25105/g.59524  ORF Transcript_25105/g.59524 Transcript_25105/m.59524 type:complete len:1178 (-) Transcript_25105:240-3773(-)
MYVQEIIIDGFKSYAKRTVVDGFDPMFNAITGLNGSGKSNILDSICFVLGISRLEQVRAGSLQELVYKQGQAGVTRASVTIVFNNKDKKGSPVGYEAYDEITVCRQVAIGGRNKYLINGHVAQQNRVQNMFHSVQLNINNPHFLIMQGRITKVINMSPQEILGLIAEAAGTKMYEAKKDAAIKTIEKKQAKVEEIQKILAEDITPSLDKLRKERAAYMQWSAGNGERDRLERFCTAWNFNQAESITKKSSEEMKTMQAEKQGLEDSNDSTERDIKDQEVEIKALQARKDTQMGGEVKELEARANDLSKVLVKATSSWQHRKENLAADEKSVTKLKKALADLDKARAASESKVSGAEGKVKAIQEETTQATTRLEELQRQRQALQAGCDADSAAGDKTLAEQLKDAKAKASAAVSELKQVKIRMEHLKKELEGRRKGAKSAGKEFEKLQAELVAAEGAAKAARAAADLLKEEASLEAAIRDRERAADKGVRELREAVDKLASQVSGMEVEYRDPSANFDRRKVKGIVASLIRLKDAKTATAIEVACGGKLYQLVVQDEVTGKDLLSKGQLRRRVTIIPLNKIEGSALPASTLKNAEQAVGKGRADLALELVGFAPELERAMKYVLGKTMVCQDVEAAKACAFTDGVKARSVTLEGDLFDPAGTLTGGHRAKASSSVLLTFGELLDKRAALADAEEALAALRREAGQAKTAADKYAALEQKATLAEHQGGLVRKRLEGNPYFTAAEDLRKMEEEVAGADENSTKKEAERAAADKEVARLEAAVKEFSASWDKLMEGKDKEVAAERKKLEGLQKKLKEVREATENILLESAAALEEHAAVVEQIKAAEAALAPVVLQVEAAAAEVADAREAYEAAEAAAKAKREAVKQADLDIKNAGKDCDKARSRLEKQQIALKKLEHTIARFEKDSADAHKAVEHLLRQHAWIAAERHLFGTVGTDYDFASSDPAKAERRLKEVAGEQEKLGKKINKKVMGMFEKAEQEYQEVMTKKRIVENDKAKIEAVMVELDEKKNQALKTTWAKVNRDFSSIFHTLLPNAQAKLQPPEGGTVLDGLVLKVGFGDCWKESLSELSGGQRSLLALSLILALLLFKPAPMYILDEIDAALDLSHTQNIGSMLRTHFKNSQFIIVSLKEGMFNNANVLYRTKFVDGVSTVSRPPPAGR